MVTDPIANLINGLKNASSQKKAEVSVPYSKLKESILAVLKNEDFIEDFKSTGKEVAKKQLEVVLKYDEDGNPKINDVKRISKSSRRIYRDVKNMFPVKNGYGMSVYSTPKGVISGKQAKKENVGGEVLFEIW